jgi:Domain of unknown function (DUF1707)
VPAVTGPGDDVAAGAGALGRLRASHADREQVIDVLKAAFVQERLDRDEFDLRVGQALGSRTFSELAALTADLPAGQPAARPPERARPHGARPVLRPVRVIAVVTAIYAGVWAVVIPMGQPVAVPVLTITSLLFYIIVVLIGLEKVSPPPYETRPGSQPRSGPPPGAGGRASRPSPPAGLAGPPPPVDHGRHHTAEAARSRRPRPPRLGAASPGWSVTGQLTN